MPNLYHCVLTEAETLWRQHGETLNTGSHEKKEIASCELWGRHYQQIGTFRQHLAQASEDINVIREVVIGKAESLKTFEEVLQSHVSLLSPFFMDTSCKVENHEGKRVTVTLDEDMLLAIIMQYPQSVELMRTSIDQFQSISDIASECAHVAESIELACQVLDDQEILDCLEEGEVQPRVKSVAVQYAHDELPLPSLFCLEATRELIRADNVEMITLMLRLILDSSKKLMQISRESFPIMRESIDDVAMKSFSVRVAREKAELQSEEQLRRRPTLSVVK